MASNDLVIGGLNSTSNATDIIPIVPSDTADLSETARASRCAGTGGNLRSTTWDGPVRNTTIAAGEVLTVIVSRVHATGTTAPGLEALV